MHILDTYNHLIPNMPMLFYCNIIICRETNCCGIIVFNLFLHHIYDNNKIIHIFSILKSRSALFNYIRIKSMFKKTIMQIHEIPSRPKLACSIDDVLSFIIENVSNLLNIFSFCSFLLRYISGPYAKDSKFTIYIW